jgi:hypothetical protein
VKFSKTFIPGFILIMMIVSCHKNDILEPMSGDNTDTLSHQDTIDNNDTLDHYDTVMYTRVVHDIQITTYEGQTVFWNEKADKQFIPRGVNYFWIVPSDYGLQDRFFGVGIFDEEQTRHDFHELKSKGYNVVRFFMDNCNNDPICIGNTEGKGLNGDYIDNIVRTMEIARDQGIYLLLTSNDLPDDGGYWDLSNQGANDQFEEYRNAHYLTSKGIESAQLYWGDLLRALSERNAPFETVFAWSLLNEQWYFYDNPPFNLTSGMVTCANEKTYDMSSMADKKGMALEGIRYYIKSVRSVIDQYDPDALVTMGFFVPDYPNPMRTGDFRYVETAGLLTSADLDFFDFHAYPGDEPLNLIAENFGITGYDSKPVIMGEFGAFIDRYATIDDATEAVQAWMAQSCQYGYDGWLYWGLYRAPEEIGDATWGFYDAEEQMFDSLSPELYPDACDENLLPPENIALDKDVTASVSISGEEPENVVDGNYTSQWGAGDYASQWVEIDLGAEYDIGIIKLYVAQYPEGNTKHTLEAKGETGDWQTLYNFSQFTAEGDVLEYQTTATNSFRYIRITTTDSPSWVAWKEIEVFRK